ncbi:Mannan endo-1,4-beta-mannosidase [Frankliniella fusca]|uniref:Mannan endo-1,4-beta-mannosidase n=1 Tax=Frankliniella fusca TaxID=407009 RepID=A0AAE1LNA3_9NEOP|nr:Mannan endo-1,4-beta-mannosidase [Frankliniella fusca]
MPHPDKRGNGRVAISSWHYLPKMNVAAVICFFVGAVACQVAPAYAKVGFSVSGTTILAPNGSPFVMRGINYAHSWFKNDAEVAIPAIAATGANVIRIVLSDGGQYTEDKAADVVRLLNLCEQNKLVAILEASIIYIFLDTELVTVFRTPLFGKGVRKVTVPTLETQVHDATGSDDIGKLRRAANYWKNLAETLKGREDRVIINIANEWFGSSGKSAQWAEGYMEVLPTLRWAGLEHLIVVDSPGWGQDAAAIAQEGIRIFEADPRRNTIFSIHMYEVAAPNAETVKRHIDNSLAIGVPLIIGEFSDKQSKKDVDYKSIMKYCNERSVGWLAWSWHGNNIDTKNMDISNKPSTDLTPLGEEIVGHIKREAKIPNIW